MRYRPWGNLSWMLDRLRQRSWDTVGSLSMETRSTEAWRVLKLKGLLRQTVMLDIRNPQSTYASECAVQITHRLNEFSQLGGSMVDVRKMPLFCRSGEIEEVFRRVCDSESVVVDISCLPKRYFFLLIKLLLKNPRNKDLLVTYTVPQQYDPEKPLAEDPEPWTCLPGFLPRDDTTATTLVVGIGYEPLGLPQILESSEFRQDELRILFPFPSPGRGYERNWRFVLDIARRRQANNLNISRVDNKDVSAIFDAINKVTDNGKTAVALAPFGPKTLSLAMCLYATSEPDGKEVPVYYTQPRSYNPNYSSGIKVVNGVSETYGYLLKQDGQSLY
jgi:hypothetical protein